MSKSMLPHLATRLFDTPLLIHPAKLDMIMSVMGSRMGLNIQNLAAPSAAELAALAKPKTTVVQMQVGAVQASGKRGSQVTMGIIPVFGTLVHRAGGVDAMSGLRSYESIRTDFNRAINDPSLDAVGLELGSCGGEGHGCFDLVDEIFKARKESGKLIFGIANEQAYSAGYAILSACELVYLTRTAGVGSIGVISRHLDKSGKDEMDGLQYTTMYEGDRKNDFSAESALTPEAAEVMRQNLKSTHKLFVDTVARNMGLKTKIVRETEAGIYTGKAAVQAGLAHAVLSFNQAIEQVAKKTKRTGGISMSGEQQHAGLQHQLEALFKGSSDQEVALALAPMGYMSSTNVITEEAQTAHGAERFAAGQTEGKKEGLDYAGEILGMCALAKKPEMAESLIAANVDLAAARKQLVDSAAITSTALGAVSSTVSVAGAGAISSLVANAQARKDA